MQIDSYFDEGKKQWKTASSLVTGRAFYELWESVCQPEPFLLPETFEIAGRPFVLSGASGTLCGRCEWSEAFQCASLIAECDSWRKEYLLRFGPSGEPEITEQEKIFFDDAGLLSGELLELVSEVVAYIREHGPLRSRLLTPLCVPFGTRRFNRICATHEETRIVPGNHRTRPVRVFRLASVWHTRRSRPVVLCRHPAFSGSFHGGHLYFPLTLPAAQRAAVFPRLVIVLAGSCLIESQDLIAEILA